MLDQRIFIWWTNIMISFFNMQTCSYPIVWREYTDIQQIQGMCPRSISTMWDWRCHHPGWRWRVRTARKLRYLKWLSNKAVLGKNFRLTISNFLCKTERTVGDSWLVGRPMKYPCVKNNPFWSRRGRRTLHSPESLLQWRHRRTSHQTMRELELASFSPSSFTLLLPWLPTRLDCTCKHEPTSVTSSS